MIISFGDRATEDLYHGRESSKTRQFPNEIMRSALRKLDIMHAAHRLGDLRVPPGNRLHKLTGNLDGYYSIRVNDQWRIIFQWRQSDCSDVSLTDYHD